MPSVGPQVPPHLAKRKRSPEDDGAPTSPRPKIAKPNRDDESSSDDGYGPSAPAPRRSSPKTSIGPAIPPAKNTDEIDLSDSDSDTGPAPPPRIGPSMSTTPPRASPKRTPRGPTMPSKRNTNEISPSPDSDTGRPPLPKRTIGPSMPPAALSERPPPSESDSDSDSSDYGPALPSATTTTARPVTTTGPLLPTTGAEPAKRDDWMLAPPTQSGYHERDTTKIKHRTFRSNPQPAHQTGVASIWTETATEKMARLQNAVLGREDEQQHNTTDNKSGSSKKTRDKEEDARRQRQIDEYNASTRGKRSLYEERKEARKTGGVKKDEEEDDPSKRGFNWEKDMAVSGKIGGKEKRELVNKAAGFSGRFQKGSYL